MASDETLCKLKAELDKNTAFKHAVMLGFLYLTIGMALIAAVGIGILTKANRDADRDRQRILEIGEDVRALVTTIEECVGEDPTTACRERSAMQTGDAIGRIVLVTCDFARLNDFEVPPDCPAASGMPGE